MLQAPNIVSQPPEVSKKNSALMGVPRIMEVAQSDVPPTKQSPFTTISSKLDPDWIGILLLFASFGFKKMCGSIVNKHIDELTI